MQTQNEDSKNTSVACLTGNDNATLAELLKGYDGPVKLRAKDGSGFIYCGKIADIPAEDVNNELIGIAAESIAYQDERLNIIRRNGATLSAFFDKMVSDARNEGKATLPKFRIGDYLTYLEQRAEQLAFHYARGVELREYCKKLRPFMNRKVVDMYESIDPDEKDVMIVIVEGTENMPAWTTAEYKSEKFEAKRNEHILLGIKYRQEVLGENVDNGSSAAGGAVHGRGGRRRVSAKRRAE